jgi:hypothetical protein
MFSIFENRYKKVEFKIMAAFVQFKSYIRTKTSSEFYVGTGRIHRENWFNVISVQCDGDELFAACQILGLEVTQRVYTFIGFEAQTIMANWK